MFHYTNHGTRGSERGSHDIAVGDWVQSKYRAPWRGVVVELKPHGGVAVVRQVLDRRGNPIRKPRTVEYHCRWFTKVPTKETPTLTSVDG